MLNAELLGELYERYNIPNYYGVTFPQFVFDLGTKVPIKKPGEAESIDSRISRLVEIYTNRQIEYS
ncbi:MAG: hypothetical protein AABX25_04620 [Nanoarchaeota archaeon]